MNTENFKEFLENPSRLYQLSYQELKSLVLQYPYSTNLHYLLLQKSAMENHRDLEQNRQKAATYSINRTFLFKLFRELTLADKKEPVLQLDEEFLELKDLSLLEIDTPPIAVADDLLQTPASALPLVDLQPLDIQEEEEEEEEAVDLSSNHVPILEFEPPKNAIAVEAQGLQHEDRTDTQPSSPPPTINFYQPNDQVIGITTAISTIISQLSFSTSQNEPERSSISTSPTIQGNDHESPPLQVQKQLLNKLEHLISKHSSPSDSSAKISKPAPQPKKCFSSWVQQFQSDHVKQQLSELMEAKKRDELKRLKKQLKKAKKKKNKKTKANKHIIKFAEQSLTKHQAIVSETLAEILTEQGEIQKALEMYERLKLFFPEKSTYFAAIIEKLKIE